MNGPVLRLIDANANRAREALRVLEDYARFVLNSNPPCAALKNIRHELAEVLGPLLGEAILFRDTPGDVGTAVKTDAEMTRNDVSAVVVAAGKRLGEALRAIEEFLKVLGPITISNPPPLASSSRSSPSARIESLRYRFYDIERQIALTFRGSSRLKEIRLYVLITESACRRPWLEAAELAIDGGADALQLREKNLDGQELLHRARLFCQLCRRRNVLSIINDRVDVALLADADGVHLGQQDLPAADARHLMGNTKIIGVSTHEIAQARQAVLDGADYIGVGPIYKSPTKPRDFVAGLAYAAEVAREITIPAVAIAGIGPQNVDDVMKTGLRAIAVTAAVIGSDDIASAARTLKERLMR